MWAGLYVFWASGVGPIIPSKSYTRGSPDQLQLPEDFNSTLFPHRLKPLERARPQGDHIELRRKRHGYRFEHFHRKRKKEAREVHNCFAFAQMVKPVAEDEMFRVIHSCKCRTKQWKRMVTKATFVGPGFTKGLLKYERFIQQTGLRFTQAHLTHPELKCTFNLEIIGIKKNPNGPMYTSIGVITKGTIIEVNVSELGLVTQKGKVV